MQRIFGPAVAHERIERRGCGAEPPEWLRRSREQRRTQLVRDVLDGADPDPAAALGELDYDLRLHHLACVVAGPDPERALRALARDLDPPPALGAPLSGDTSSPAATPPAQNSLATNSSPLPRNTVAKKRSSFSPMRSRTTPTNHSKAIPANGSRLRAPATARRRRLRCSRCPAARPS